MMHTRAVGRLGSCAALIATLLSTADSALLAFHASESSSASGPAFAERERLHRALSMGRVLAYIAAGASLAQALQLENAAARCCASIVTRRSRRHRLRVLRGRRSSDRLLRRRGDVQATLADDARRRRGAESRRRARVGHRSLASHDHSRQRRQRDRARDVDRAVPRGRRRRGGRLVRRGGADSRRVLARRDRGAGDHGAARRHRRHRRDDAVVRGARPRAQLRARALSGVSRHARRSDGHSLREGHSPGDHRRRRAGERLAVAHSSRRHSFRSPSASTNSCANFRRAARTSRS